MSEMKLTWFVYSGSRKDDDLNSHTPWSAWDIEDLTWAAEHNKSVKETANFLCRTEYECKQKAIELGLR